MKTHTVSNRTYYACTMPGANRFPNSAQRRLTAEKLVEGALAAVITLSVVLVAVVLLTM